MLTVSPKNFPFLLMLPSMMQAAPAAEANEKMKIKDWAMQAMEFAMPILKMGAVFLY